MLSLCKVLKESVQCSGMGRAYRDRAGIKVGVYGAER